MYRLRGTNIIYKIKTIKIGTLSCYNFEIAS